jgi:serine/threonine protein kinase
MTMLSPPAVARLRAALTTNPVPSRYVLHERIGEGGMGVVWRAHDTVLGRDVAVKVLAPHLGDGDFGERLEREARLLATLEHPGMVPVFDMGTGEAGGVWYAMQFVHGVRLDAAARQGRPLRELLRIVEDVCNTVAYAHAHGVVHRDLKPGNVMLGPFGETLVLDWGVATGGDASEGLVMGTPGFMAPEQLAGGSVDGRADIHALGVMTGELVRLGGHSAPAALRSIIARACATDRTSRYATAVDLRDELRRFAAGERVLAHRESAAERAARFLATYQTAVILVLAYLIMRLIVLLWRGI